MHILFDSRTYKHYLLIMRSVKYSSRFATCPTSYQQFNLDWRFCPIWHSLLCSMTSAYQNAFSSFIKLFTVPNNASGKDFSELISFKEHKLTAIQVLLNCLLNAAEKLCLQARSAFSQDDRDRDIFAGALFLHQNPGCRSNRIARPL
jgi:hypothetical protein